ncbi:MAG: N-formylglutamate deformylase [Woeseiaceae bacterium]
MSKVFAYHEGNLPLLISVPHDGRDVPQEQRERMTDAGLELPDTDWHVAELYSFARELGASMLVANYSRYVVDLNRPADDAAMYEGQVATGLCPQYTFAGAPLYKRDAAVRPEEANGRVEKFWHPYHEKLGAALADMRASHGYALLWDAHSIASRVPRLFDGELPVFNLGTYDDRSCDPHISQALLEIAEASPYQSVLNGRFKGGYITRHYGDPAGNVHAVQLELAQRGYMDEQSRTYDDVNARRLQITLRRLLEAFATAAVQ